MSCIYFTGRVKFWIIFTSRLVSAENKGSYGNKKLKVERKNWSNWITKEDRSSRESHGLKILRFG